jgi:hypothetical protein
VLLFPQATAEWFCRARRAKLTPMGFFRSMSRFGSYLALFAIAFQLAVSFTHVHLDHIRPAAAGASVQLGGEQASAPSSRSDHENLADDCCPICALVHLAGTMVPAETPPLPLPHIFLRLRHETAFAFDLTAQPRVLFQARAPPLA